METEQRKNYALSFLSHFPGNHILITQPDADEGAVWHHPIGVLGDVIMERNDVHQCGVFFTVQELDQSLDPTAPDGSKQNRTIRMLSAIRAFFADDDVVREGPREDWPLKPTLTVNTSPGKYHYYWILEKPVHCGYNSLEAQEWVLIQKGLNVQYGTDRTASQVNRILRIPGFYHHKHAPHPVTYTNTGSTVNWAQIKEAFPPMNKVEATTLTKDGEDWKFHLNELDRNKAENAHPHYVAAALSLANSGTPPEVAAYLLAGEVCALFEKHGRAVERWRGQRIKDAVMSAYDKVRQEVRESKVASEALLKQAPVPQVQEDGGTKYTHMPQPGGGLYDVKEWVKKIMRYPNNDIALVVAEHLVSVFGGGHYHISGNTTTRKRIMLAPLGAGKNTITRALSKLVKNLGSLNGDMPWVLEADKFLGTDSFSFSVQHKQVEEHRVRSFLVNEAGEAGKSKAGDIAGLTSYQLQVLSTKADEQCTPKQYSQQGKNGEEKKMNTVYNGVWVYMHESTLRSYASLLKNSDAFVNGDLSRSDIFFMNPQLSQTNYDHADFDVPREMLQLFATMANDLRALPGQEGSKDYDVWESVDTGEIADRLVSLEKEIVAQRNTAYANEDEVMTALLGRRYERIITAILVASIADAAKATRWGDRMGKPVARHHHLDYAIARAEALDASLLYHTRGGGVLADPYEHAREKFINGFHRSVTLGHGIERKGDTLYVTKTWLQRRLQVHLKGVAETYHNGDGPKAFNAFLRAYNADDDLFVDVTYFNSRGDLVKEPNRWMINPHIVNANEVKYSAKRINKAPKVNKPGTK